MEGIAIDPIGALVAVLVYELLFVSTMGLVAITLWDLHKWP